jgi:chromosome segregation ATPase
MTHKAARKIYPKISTMPRPQSEASAHLEMYKLLVEKHRLQQELQSLDQRQQQIVERLAALEGQVSQLDATATKLSAKLPATASAPHPAQQSEPRGVKQEFNTLLLEY